MPSGEYTSGIEGPAVDAGGTLYVVNFQREGTIGKVSLGATQSELFATLLDGCIGNGIRFDRDGRMGKLPAYLARECVGTARTRHQLEVFSLRRTLNASRFRGNKRPNYFYPNNPARQ
jgi:hypothetical protein